LRSVRQTLRDEPTVSEGRARHVAWLLQRAACLVLGSAIIIDSLASDKPLAELIVGCVVLGVLPLDTLADIAERLWRRPERDR
jgi:hypothetical protein